MHEKEIKFSLRVFENKSELSKEDADLLNEAKNVLQNSYSPYSRFKVAAVILLANGKTVSGTNQENAAFPAGVCAEGIALGAASSLYPETALKKVAITVKSGTHVVNHPVAPCGICRQKLLEYETRFNKNIEIILQGEKGEIYSVKSVKDLLPLHFSNSDL